MICHCINLQSLSRITNLLWWRALSNSMKLWVISHRVPQNGQVIVKSSDKMWSTGGGNGKPLWYSYHENPWIVWKGKKIWHQKMSSPSQKVCNMLLGKSRGQLLIAPERMMQVGQSRNDWLCLVMKVKSNAVKNSID